MIYNGVDPKRFTPNNNTQRPAVRQRYGINRDVLLLLFVGEYRRKGLANVIRALGLLQRPDVHLLAVGRGDHALFSALADSAGVSAQVTFAGPTTDIECVFGAADAFVFPTLYEPFGMVITEAMASGLPVLTSRRAGAAEMIEDGVNGLLLDNPGDTQELAQKLEIMLSKSFCRSDVGIRGSQSVSHYDWTQVADETMVLYRQVVQERQQERVPKQAIL